ncbi:TRAP transporter small permease [Microbaculum marinisediminis]|uniref:TRAP transporter small permease protein n=1 Tax=Microbaculum marinisediminis TaxID=2931392 RepID=A0AAW5R024_9HYPH|nr:TRAP transporter small permease [Microbaculum sp. A6E488]MCT8973532.1 TRAP transporter small permease [Microbaculum sp. A6E488]
MTESASDKTTAPGIPLWIERLLSGAVAIIIFAMMSLTFVDVFFRYFFNAPIPGSFEIVQFLLALLIFSALPLVSGAGGHITVDLFEHMIRGRAGRVRRIGVDIVNICGVALIGYLMWRQAQTFARYEKVTGYLELPLAALAYGLTALAVVLLFVHLSLFWHRLHATENGA